jgi:protein-arginine kinase activator protein McsA
MKGGKDIYVKIGDEWVLAKEYELDVRVTNGTTRDFYRAWPISTLKNMLNTAIEKEHYEEAGIITEVINEKP